MTTYRRAPHTISDGSMRGRDLSHAVEERWATTLGRTRVPRVTFRRPHGKACLRGKMPGRAVQQGGEKKAQIASNPMQLPHEKWPPPP